MADGTGQGCVETGGGGGEGVTFVLTWTGLYTVQSHGIVLSVLCLLLTWVKVLTGKKSYQKGTGQAWFLGTSSVTLVTTERMAAMQGSMNHGSQIPE